MFTAPSPDDENLPQEWNTQRAPEKKTQKTNGGTAPTNETLSKKGGGESQTIHNLANLQYKTMKQYETNKLHHNNKI